MIACFHQHFALIMQIPNTSINSQSISWQEFTVKSFHSDYVVKDVPKSKKGVRGLLPDRISQSCFFNQ